MANRVPNNGENLSNDGFLSSIKRNAIPAAVVAALAAYSGKAEAAWQCENNFDTNPDGTSAGTSYNDGSTVYSFAGERGGLSFRGIDDGIGGALVERTTDGVAFTDITNDIRSADSSLTSADFDISGYNPDTDELMIKDYNTNVYWVISGASTSSMTATELQGTGNSVGSIDISTGKYVGTEYVDASLRSDVYEFTDAGSPTELYSYSGDDSLPQADLNNDRLFVMGASYKTYEITNASSGSPTRTEITGTNSGAITYFLPNNYSSTGYDELHLQNSSYELEYCYDDASYATTTPVDTDGDGYNDEDDCAPTDATAYPGAPVSSDDGVDSDCDENGDLPSISSLTVAPASTIAPGETVSLRASVGDDETANSSLTYEWSVEDSGGSVLDTATSESTTFTTTEVGTFTAFLTVTDAQGNTVTDSTTFDVVDETVEVPSITTAEVGSTLNGTYSGLNGSGSATLTNVEVLADNVLYIDEDSSITDATDFEAEFESAAAVGGSTSAEWDGEMIMGMRFAQGSTEYPYADTMNTDEMLYVVLDGETDGNVGSVSVLGSHYDGDDLELNETFTTAGEYLVSDIVDDTEDTGGPDDTGPDDTGPQDTDTGVPDDTDPQDTNVETDSGDTDAEKPANDDTGVGGGNEGGCNSCATVDGANGTWAIGAAALAALAVSRRRKEDEEK